jgi:hypothetical protein
MGVSVSLQAGLIKFDVKISEFAQTVQDFVGASLDAKARDALKTMIAEVDKDFELVAEVMSPLYSINNVADFQRQWPQTFANFTARYLTSWHSLATHCGIVTAQLQRVQKAHNWKRRIPVLGDAVKRLEDMSSRWMGNDSELYTAMQEFMDSMHEALKDVNGCRTPAKAVKKLKDTLNGTERSLLSIKGYSNELKRLSAAL